MAFNPSFSKRSFRFSQREVRDLFIAWLAISLAFMFVVGGRTFSADVFLLSAITVGVAFLLHELAHKFVAQYYHAHAEFRMFGFWLFLAVAFAFAARILFAAPGAVMISNVKNTKQFGHIAVAGPITNIVLALLFLFVPGQLGFYGFLINSWLALFNMLPVGPLDGKKVKMWSPTAFWIVLGISAVLTFFAFVVPF